ncbi:MAG: terminase [Alphaproteobacteria bacterium CG_4_10_14_0_2_um_filter_63_37]|nr:MAG: terminase [Proteobacteria bacterium CG1_02_64_396]PJA25665.1 MAG: terminase [Alphaproteobacteria bacterium CG_4_10_14_0_2_um_filter_63_37]
MSAPLLYPYQQRWLADRTRFKVGMFARQTGKTFTTTLEIVLDCVRAEAAGKRTRWVILSRGERQAREAMEEGVKRHLQALQAAFELVEIDQFEGVQIKALEVTLPGGSRITALPANPDTARGFSSNVFLDEFGFHADSRKIWTALFPVISAGWKLRVVSTPNGKGNKFYELMTDRDPESPWSRHVVDIYQAVADGLPRDIDLLRKGINDPDAWAQEYELNWLDEASAWLSYDLINAVEHDDAGLPERYLNGRTYIGNDIAARNDLWCSWVWERVGDVLWTREIVTLKRASFREQDQTLDALMRRYNPVRLCMDQTGMGEKPVEDAKRRYGDSRVEGVLFTGDAKQHLAHVAKEAFEDRKVRIPSGNEWVRADLHSLRKVTTAAGNIRFDVEGGDGHADRAWAAFLGIYAASPPPTEYAYTPAPGKHSRWDGSFDDDDDDPLAGAKGAW